MNMNKLIAVLALAIMIASCKSTEVKDETSNPNYFEVQVEQYGKIVPEKNGVIQLDKAPFIFKLALMKTRKLYVSTSFGTVYYDFPNNENLFECEDYSEYKGCMFSFVNSGAEELYNVEKDLQVAYNEYHNTWFYLDDEERYFMDKEVVIKDGVVYAQVTVEHIFDTEKMDDGHYREDEYIYPIESISQNLYMVFASSHDEEGVEHPIEEQRKKVMLKF